MQLRTTLLSTLLISLFIASSASAAVTAPPRSDSDHKFSKREPEPGTHYHTHHYHGGSAPASSSGGTFGSSGGSMMRTIVGGTALAGGAAFAGTAGSIGAHKLFDGHRDEGDEDGREGRGRDDEGGIGKGGEYQQRMTPMSPQQQTVGTGIPSQTGGGGEAVGGLRPIAILMSDGSYQPLPEQGLPAYRQTALVSNYGGGGAGAGGAGGAGAGTGAGTGTGGFTFPQSK